MLWLMNLGFAAGSASSSASGESRLTAFQIANLGRGREFDALIKREDEEIIAIIMAAWEVL